MALICHVHEPFLLIFLLDTSPVFMEMYLKQGKYSKTSIKHQIWIPKVQLYQAVDSQIFIYSKKQ